MSIDYTVLYRRRLTLEQVARESRSWSKFVSGWNPTTERVRKVYDAVDLPPDAKLWIVQPEYRFEPSELPGEPHVQPQSRHEAELWDECLEKILAEAGDGRLCVDLTGLMRPHLICLVRTLLTHGVDRFFALYSDPDRYKAAENTKFQGPVSTVRQIAGFEGLHEADTSNDLLVIGMGYEDELIRHVASSKNHAKKVPIFGLPSLQPDMYQQSVLRVAKASEALGAVSPSDIAFAPANDPFATAKTLRDIVGREQARKPITNLYLASLGTKPQALGFALYYLAEQRDGPASILFPFAESYARETGEGLARSWLYEVRITGG